MKHNFIKKIVGFLSAAAITLTSAAVPDVYAEESGAEEELVFNSMEEYIEYSVPRHLYAQGITTGETFEYSEPVALYDFESNSVIGSEVFIFDDNKLIAKTEIYDTEEGYVSTLDTYIPDNLMSAYSEGEEIAMGHLENSLLMYSVAEGYSHIDGLEKYDSPLKVPQELKKIVKSGVAASSFPVTQILHGIYLNTQHVPNATSKYFPQGECWAACLAMKLNFEQDRYNAGLHILTAENVSNQSVLLEYAKPNPDSIFSNYSVDILAMYKYYGYQYIERTYEPKTHHEIHDILGWGIPLVMYMYKANEPSAVGHAVLIKGIALDTSLSTYIIDDPNISSDVTVDLSGNPSQTYPSFFYQYGNYDQWAYTDF